MLSRIKSLLGWAVTVEELAERVDLVEVRLDALLARVEELEGERQGADNRDGDERTGDG